MTGSMTPPAEPSSPTDGAIRKRVCKACDRCRLKKSKCDGASPCSRCKADNVICQFGERKKSNDKIHPKGYVEMLENQQAQLVNGLQQLYKRLSAGEGWIGAPLKESSNGVPLTHDILERLGALKVDGSSTIDTFEEDLDALSAKLWAAGAGKMSRDASFDAGSDASGSPSFDFASPTAPNFSNPFSPTQFPPTPPTNSPHHSTRRTASPLKTEFKPDYTNLDFSSCPEVYDEMEFTYDPMTDMSSGPISGYDMNEAMLSTTAMHPLQLSINPSMTMKDWALQQDPSRYAYNGQVIA